MWGDTYPHTYTVCGQVPTRTHTHTLTHTVYVWGGWRVREDSVFVRGSRREREREREREDPCVGGYADEKSERVQGLGFRGLGRSTTRKGLGFGVWGLGFRFQGLGFRVQGLGFRRTGQDPYLNLPGLGFRRTGQDPYLNLPKQTFSADGTACCFRRLSTLDKTVTQLNKTETKQN